MNSQQESGTRLHGRWLLIARAVWVGLTILSLGLVVLSVPTRLNELRHISATAVVMAFRQLSIQDVAALRQLGLSIDFYALYVLTLELLPMLFSAILALVIFWRKSDERMTLLVSLLLMLGGPPTTSAVTLSLFMSQQEWRLPVSFVFGLTLSLFLIMFYLFPDGRVVPHQAWPLVVVGSILILGSMGLFLDAVASFFSRGGWNKIDFYTLFSNPLVLWLILLVDVPFYVGISFGMAAQVYRYVRLSNAVQRQQTKWVVFGLAATLLSIIVVAASVFVSIQQLGVTSLLSTLVGLPLATFFQMVFPLSIGFSILRYRLWDVDVLVNRTLVYGVLTTMLTLVYSSSVVLLQQAFRALSGQTSTLAIVASTLGIAALFIPLRRRIQATVDKRFYRRKYDAAKTLATFGAKLRDETDLDALTTDLLNVVDQTLQPAHVSLWLRESSSTRDRTEPLS
jgi:hypothetical protein